MDSNHRLGFPSGVRSFTKSWFPLYQLSYRVIGAAGWYRTNILLRFKQALIYFSYSGNYLVPPHGIEPRPSALQAIVRTSYTREALNFGV